MTPNVRPLVAGNWKMNGSAAAIAEIEAMEAGLSVGLLGKIDTLICPTALHVAQFASAATTVSIGGQDCHTNESGAHTGDLSAQMFADIGASHIIVGHSERRTDHGESSDLVRQKAEAVHQAGLIAIICIGETEAERDAGETISVLLDQLANSVPDGATAANSVIAYEPVWAIGTGKVPVSSDVEEAHAAIREHLSSRFGGEGANMRILYGGSVKPGNAVELMSIANVDGALVGGASLKAADFVAICNAYNEIN
ncbi:MAG: triose-phosphate isomerase [Pseudomonadota bacterium]